MKKVETYNHLKIEKKWQKFWDEKKTYQTLSVDKAKVKGLKPYYVLDMFPYPSGAGLHVGHPRGYIGSDVFARFKRMQGFNVLHPMGFDSFGLPAEQYAIKTGKHPGPFTDSLVKKYKKQLEIIGFSYDWSREVETHSPEYYKWTQWIFLQLYNSYYDTKKNKAESIETLIKYFNKNGNKDCNAFTNDSAIFSALEWKNFTEKEKQYVLMSYRLAYEGYAEVNWCPEMGTVLANDEIIEDKNGNMVSERGEYPVEKKMMRQWFMRITAYADRLISGLDEIDWSSSIKQTQKNWIGKSEGSEITFYIEDKEFGNFISNVDIFTTRADTLFGVTYIALAIDHPIVERLLKEQITNWDQVYTYIQEVKKQEKNDLKEITGIKLEGIVAKQSFLDIEIPIYLTNYVLSNYGTGAVMGVPAHDERDFKFAEKYDLPIQEVIIPSVIDLSNPPQKGKETKTRNTVHVIVYNKKTDSFLTLRWKKFDWHTIVLGGIDDGEDVINAALREVKEETGYSNLLFKRILGGKIEAKYFAAHKNENRTAITTGVYFELIDETKVDISQEEKDNFDIEWVKSSDFFTKKMTNSELPFWIERLQKGKNEAFCDYGTLINSGDFDGMDSEYARTKITEKVKGKIVTKYKMRDAIFARQRYWGEPIPLIHTKDGLIETVKEKDLPLELPKVKSYQPSGNGESPLSSVSSWVKSGYETNTMPGWAGSSWYFLRYMDPKNKKEFASKEALSYWKQVDMYIGGTEHATGHLLYSRFWHKFLKDIGYAKTEEPFKALKNQGLILATDGRKMSKRWGNVINPDEIVKTYGADTLRVYEMFMGPFEASQPWNTESIIGSRRFVERVFRLSVSVLENNIKVSNKESLRALHSIIEKVTSDIQNFSFNTSISGMMIALNTFEKENQLSKNDFLKFLSLLAPFAPHIAEELWNKFGQKGSIHTSVFPKADKKYLAQEEVIIPISVNGKVRAEIIVSPKISQEDIENIAINNEKVKVWIEGKEIKKFIYVPGKIVNIVI